MPSIPSLPGRIVAHRSEEEVVLKRLVANLCQLSHDRFPGSQPVSFGTQNLQRLESQDYWVCEKSDGIRVLLFVCAAPSETDQSVYIIDRHNTYRALSGLFFPHHQDRFQPLRHTLLDAELVLDVDPRTQTETLRLLAFDCLVVDTQNVMSRTLDKRYGRLKEWFYKPYEKMIKDHPHMQQQQPFDIKLKAIKFSYGVEDVFNVDVPALQHGTDGLIYTCVNTPYVPGTDTNLLKWKPPSENSIDFKLQLRFPPSEKDPKHPDYYSKPVFVLHTWMGGEGADAQYEPYDQLSVEDDEWEKMKASGEQVDDRIVEVHWDPQHSYWRLMRFRDDKPHGNHRTVVEGIIQSIADGVDKETLLSRSTAIRNAWKARQAQLQQISPSSAPSSNPAPHTAPHPQGTRSPAPEIRYGPLAPSLWSKVGGPSTVAGMKR